ncbi:hypothetical protein EG329_003413 [Mollisiaceae sp. DMI_Dod_QoI]|nr:hypothetical protein EG329_003413 [Helotiales sp. DMI_Dod_QoI]
MASHNVISKELHLREQHPKEQMSGTVQDNIGNPAVQPAIDNIGNPTIQLAIDNANKPIPIPDPRFCRPSKEEWYPRLHIGQHWQDHSIPVYFYIRSPVKSSQPPLPNTPLLIAFAITALGDPLYSKPKHIHFGNFLKHMIGQNPCFGEDVKRGMEFAMPKILQDRYFKQQRFREDVPVYKENAGIRWVAGKRKGEDVGAGEMKKQKTGGGVNVPATVTTLNGAKVATRRGTLTKGESSGTADDAIVIEDEDD